MTTNKPKVVIYEPSEKGATAMRKAAFRNTGPDRYVRLSDYEALQAECERLVEAQSENTATEALEYIFGKVPPSGWRKVIDERLTPPWPLEHHARAMGLFKDKPPAEAELVKALDAALMVMTSKEVRLEKRADAITLARSAIAHYRKGGE